MLAWIFEGNKQFQVWGWGEEQGETNIGSSCWGVAQLETRFVQTTFLLKTEAGLKLFCYFLFLWSQIKRGYLSYSDDVKWSHEIYLPFGCWWQQLCKSLTAPFQIWLCLRLATSPPAINISTLKLTIPPRTRLCNQTNQSKSSQHYHPIVKAADALYYN